MLIDNLPLGIENFEELRTAGCYYIDKTRLIEELLQQPFKVNQITRPRRFGKTLVMSMLAEFLDIRKDSSAIFEGLEISGNKELCSTWQNKWPVLFLSLKDIEDLDFADAYAQLADTISDLCMEHSYLAASDKVDADDKKRFTALKERQAGKPAVKNSLFLLTRMMRKHFGKPAILLIDEYDVPLAKAKEHGHYNEMLNCIRGLLGKSLKTNHFLKFAVITGCLRIAKESIFTGTNNFISNSITGDRYNRCFGFTESEVLRLLSDTGFLDHAEEMKEWYDGYRFGEEEVYCPWDVLSYVSDLRKNPNKRPENYWKNTSHNDIVRSFIDRADLAVTDKFETLLAGGYVKVKICEDLTYDLLHSSEENLWSILYLTGYLTSISSEQVTSEDVEDGQTYLKIPNNEVKTIFSDTVVEWFRAKVTMMDRKPLMDALWSGDAEKVTKLLSDLLFMTISYHNYKEDFYHAFLAGIFVGVGYPTETDKEHGGGRPDVVVKDKNNRRVIIIEAKYTKSKSGMDRSCKEAISQINLQKYAEEFLDGYQTLICYGAAFYKKQCMVKKFDYTQKS